MRHQELKAVCLCLLLGGAAFGTGCDDTKETVPRSNGYLVTAADSSQREQITVTIQAYLSALEHGNLSELAECAETDFLLCRDETAFYDVTAQLESAVLDSIDFDQLQTRDSSLMVTVDYTLTYTGSFLDTDGNSQAPGSYSHKELFTLHQTEDGLRIAGAQKTAAG